MDREYTMEECEKLMETWDKMVKQIKKKKYSTLSDDERAILFIDQESVQIEM